MEVAAVAAMFSSLKHASDIIDVIRESATTLEAAESKQQLAKAIDAIVEAKMQLHDLKENMMAKDDRIRALENALKVKGAVNWVEPYYMLKNGEAEDGPYCQQCYDNDAKLIRLQRFDVNLLCRTCHTTYYPKSGSTRRAPVCPGGSWMS